MDHGLGVTAPNPHASAAMSSRPAPRKAGTRSMGRAFRVGVEKGIQRSYIDQIFMTRTGPRVSYLDK